MMGVEEEEAASRTPLLSGRNPSSWTYGSILVVASMWLLAALSLALYFSTDPVSSAPLPHPVVILISSDGFRFGYQFKTPTPNIHRLIQNGTEAETGLIPVFPTLTFPNHYSIVTGLYPPHHGIVNNVFYDPITAEKFSMSNHDPKWWLGQPLWETAVLNGLSAATYFWPGSEVHKGPWNCPEAFCQLYNGSVPFEDRVETVLSYFDLPPLQIPSFITLYFEDPDHQGHQVGPDASEITDAVARIDALIGRLIQGLEHRGVFEDVHVILVGDHGMVGTCDTKLISLVDLAPWVQIPRDWIQYYTPLLAIRPPPSVDPAYVVAKMNEGLSSGKVENGGRLKVYLKEDLPERLHYSDSDRVTPIVGLADEGFKVQLNRTGKKECGGAHGYDNAFFSMRTIFIGHGPRFPRGRKIPSFENVQIYNLVTSILDIKGAPNDGSATFPDSVLLPTA
ncbi:ectonucleotide pyrophosphatase/phosphodiesterase family member 1-like [Vigna umbellata]|uniref:ectonucleotide pyrophosphatase/phosphodiesterase family member 1-like n=1 Tax=Vigna umbellata TaxID=87088 RepID=UPI001F5EB440|nr:ectonucleotide pyrophosphatase/phosphodiesterase family member 1-like [Vigna umbellata]